MPRRHPLNTLFLWFIGLVFMLFSGINLAQKQGLNSIPKKVCGHVVVKFNATKIPANEVKIFLDLVRQYAKELDDTCKSETNIASFIKHEHWDEVIFSGSDNPKEGNASSVLFAKENGHLYLYVEYYQGKLGNREMLLNYLSGRELPQVDD
jgi:hypothetical protein